VSDIAPVLLLNERQKQCLRLVYANLEAKEIALRLSLSPHTVNEHLRDARRVLGVSRSMQAARLLMDAEDPQRLVPKPLGVEPDASVVDQSGGPEIVASEALVGSNRYHLSAWQRLGIVVGLAVGVVVLAGALVGTTELVVRLRTKYRIDISDEPYKR
jgi:DNA-binding CsgD family transcriptional regulator